MKILTILIFLFNINTFASEVGKLGSLFIGDEAKESGLADDTEILISLNEISRADSDEDIKIYLDSSLKVYETVLGDTKISSLPTKSIKKSNFLSLPKKREVSSKSNGLILVVNSNELNELLANSANPEHSEIRVDISKDNLIWDDVLMQSDFSVQNLRIIAKNNPSGYKKTYYIRTQNDIKARLELEIRKKRNTEFNENDDTSKISINDNGRFKNEEKSQSSTNGDLLDLTRRSNTIILK